MEALSIFNIFLFFSKKNNNEFLLYLAQLGKLKKFYSYFTAEDR